MFGLVAAAGFPPLGLWPLTLLGIAGLVALLAESSGWRRAFALGWLFGVAHFTFADNWIATAFTYQAEMPPALGWAAVPLLALYLAVYPALGAAAARFVGGTRRLPLALAFAGAWVISEWLRKFERIGVPVYVLYRPGEEAPVVLPELLTKKVVLDALGSIGSPK